MKVLILVLYRYLFDGFFLSFLNFVKGRRFEAQRKQTRHGKIWEMHFIVIILNILLMCDYFLTLFLTPQELLKPLIIFVFLSFNLDIIHCTCLFKCIHILEHSFPNFYLSLSCYLYRFFILCNYVDY